MKSIHTNLPPELRPTDTIKIALLSGKVVRLPVCRPKFREWSKSFMGFRFGRKPLIDYRNTAVFAELAIMRVLKKSGWNAVWVSAYGGLHFLRDMPTSSKLSAHSKVIPADKLEILKRIQKLGKTRSCFDVFAWKGDEVIFCEAKRKGKDRPTPGQKKFIQGAIAQKFPTSSLLIVEWEYSNLP